MRDLGLDVAPFAHDELPLSRCATPPNVENPRLRMSLKRVIEALVFASQKPLLPKEIVAALRSAAEGTEDELARALSKTKACLHTLT